MVHAEQDLMRRLRATDWAAEQAFQAANNEIGLSARQLYQALLEAPPSPELHEQSKRFLVQQLRCAAEQPCDLPDHSGALMNWMQKNTAQVGKKYQGYLADRRSGQPRRFFQNKSHALHFLNGVAPTKLVDGAWLYGVLKAWQDPRYGELIRIYLEELGDGEPSQNHVLLYQKLLAEQECLNWENLSDLHFVQGAIQLALALHADCFLPEVIGFNLGYEQLPLHLPITAYELDELGIDPYYFTLHITIDNAASGHAARAVRAVHDALPQMGDRAAFFRRLKNGYRLNRAGLSSTQVIANFDLNDTLYALLAAKAQVGAQLHSDYCRIEGKTVNAWLSDPGSVQGFVQALQRTGWIRRHQAPEQSRFWQLLAGEKGPMFGVFNAFERQVLHDWVQGDTPDECASERRRYRYSMLEKTDSSLPSTSQKKQLTLGNVSCNTGGDFHQEERLLRTRLAQASHPRDTIEVLLPWLSPRHHATPLGLLATRLFIQALRA